MSFADNVLAKMKATPSFRPSSLDTFGDWSIEAGDVIQVNVEGKTENVPIFSSDMSWNGSAETTISCSGNQKREMQDRQTRQAYNTAYGINGRISKVQGDLERDSVELKARITNAEAGMEAVTERKYKRDAQGNIIYLKDKNGNPILDENGQPVPDYEYAQSSAKVAAALTEYDKDGNKHGIEALLDLLAVKNKDGSYTSMATISATAADALGKLTVKAYKDPRSDTYVSLVDVMADVISLVGKIEVLGQLTVQTEAGQPVGIGTTGSIMAGGNINTGGDIYLTGGGVNGSAGIWYGAQFFRPEDITSTDGDTHTVLGYK